MAYPSDIDAPDTVLDDSAPDAGDGTEIIAAHHNEQWVALVALETTVGIPGSAVTSTLDYLLKSTASVDPGHKHSNASINNLAHTKLTYASLTTNHALIASGAGAAAFRAILETDIAAGSTFARLGAFGTISAVWVYQQPPAMLAGVAFKSVLGAGYTTLLGHANSGNSTSFNLPDADGSAGNVLTTDGSGNLEFTAAGSGDVSGPGASVDNALAFFDDTSGASVDDASIFVGYSSLGLQFGGLTASFPGVKRAGARLAHRLADDSAYGEIEGAAARMGGIVIVPVADLGAFGASTAGELRHYTSGGSLRHQMSATEHLMASGVAVNWRSATSTLSGATDLGLARAAAGELKVTDGSTGYGKLHALQAILRGATSGTIALAAPASGASVTYTLPGTDGTTGQLLSTNGSGLLTWVTGSGGSGSDANAVYKDGSRVMTGALHMQNQVGDPTLLADGEFYFKSDGAYFRHSSTGVVKIGAGGGTSALSGITAATGNATVAHGTNAIVWTWSNLTTQTGFKLGETGGGSTSGVVAEIEALTSTVIALRVGGRQQWREPGSGAAMTRRSLVALVATPTSGSALVDAVTVPAGARILWATSRVITAVTGGFHLGIEGGDPQAYGGSLNGAVGQTNDPAAGVAPGRQRDAVKVFADTKVQLAPVSSWSGSAGAVRVTVFIEEFAAATS